MSGIPHCERTVVVLGAGIQGVTVALALRRAGWTVTLVDRAPAPLIRTSLVGEGKLHLGYVYGNDPGGSTAALMVEGALSFAASLDRWLPRRIDWASLRSEPFRYAILADSMVAPEQLAAHYRRVDDAIAARFDRGATYAGMPSFTRSAPLASPRSGGFTGDVVAAHQTCEIAVDPGVLRRYLLEGLQAQGITCTTDCVVTSVERTRHGFKVTGTHPDGAVITRAADAVVNCLWEGRLAIDATMGIPPPRPCSYRLKFTVNATMDPERARNLTTTFALGPFGDVVCRSGGRIYLSWYPVCMAGLSTGLEPPSSWQQVLDGSDPAPATEEVAADTLAALAGRIEALRGARIDSVAAGVVVAWGDSDIDQPGSELHRRHGIGVHAYDGYLSVDTGKLTTAPLFAGQVVEALGSQSAAAG